MIRYRPHAEQQMWERGIERAWVEEAVANPDWTEQDPRHPGRTRSYKAIPALGGRVPRVVHWPDGADVVVLTAHQDRQASRRRKP